MTSTAWQTYAKGQPGLALNGDGIMVELDRARSHRVQVIHHADGWELSSFACGPEQLTGANLSPQDLWYRNRSLALVGFVVDGHGDVWVTAWLPIAGLTAAEFQFAAREVAIEADRLEFHATGMDQF
ncbi:MAG: hypothetical protein ABI565_11380 [Vicinamibacteria bacterium]